MPWDQPGSGGDKDPWGQKKNNQQGPPDLDKVIKDIKDKLGLSRGGRGRGDNSSDGSAGGQKPSYGMFVIIAIVAVGF